MIERWRGRIANIASIGGPGAVTRLGPTIIYHASEASRFMTGSVLVIDGGQLLT